MKFILSLVAAFLLLSSCQHKQDFDGSGNFEADEVIVSAGQNGVLLSYRVKEGMNLHQGDTVGQIDVRTLELQKQQTEAGIDALKEKTTNPQEQESLIRKQIAVQQTELAHQLRERNRTENLVKADAATQKQLDDINAAIQQLQKQIEVTREQLRLSVYNTNNQNRSILSEKKPMEKAAAGLEEQINKGQIINPVNGTVLVNYALKGERQTIGKPLYKIANLDTLNLKAYITGTQLSQIKLGEQVTVRIDSTEDSYRNYTGIISWISDKAEFSPKNIQTKDERANLVYAIKVKVKNDGLLKIGMYAEVIWSEKTNESSHAK